MKKLIYGKGKTGQAVENFCERKNIPFIVSDDASFYEKLLDDVDEVIVSPGVPFFSKIYRAANKRSIPVIGEIEFAFRFAKGKIIAITGTDGKTTTASMTYKVLKDAGFDAYIGGNYGIPFISFVDNLTDESITVLELSSFQLYSIKTFKPDIGAILNIDTDHLDWHKKESHYCLSKLKITKNQTQNDFLLIHESIYPLVKKVSKANVVPIQELKGINLKLTGKHNYENAYVAYTIGKLLNVEENEIKKSLEDFSPLEHRLEPVENAKGLKIYNDSKATTVQAVKKALESIHGEVIWIGGGINKGGDFSTLKPLLEGKAKKIILIGKDKEQIKKQLGLKNIHLAQTLKDAVKVAIESADKNDTILFSPGCASFDMFKSYLDRGEQFKALIKRFSNDK